MEPDSPSSPGTTPQEFQQATVEEVFERMRELPRAQRERALDAEPCTDAVRHEVRSLLRYDRDSTPTMGGAPAVVDPAALIGQSAGGFTLRTFLGAGGMGLVFEADQDLPARRVAMKVLRGAIDRPALLARFRRESEFLARLDHPNIARVITAGTLRLADGAEHPYFAMELVDGGRPLNQWASETRAPLRESMRVFAEACDAIGHGHRRGVLHLDIKPGNLLVSATGAARVIDYGIARSIDDGSPERAFVGTPQYMAPERFRNRGADADSRADVFSLGVVLYELLAGRMPYSVRGATAEEAARIAEAAEIPHPCRVDANAPRALGDIAMKCLSIERDARYGTASEIADEIRRWLAGDAVLASPEGLATTALRVLRRNRLTAAISMLAVVVMLSATFVSIGAALDARAAAERERLEAAHANQRAASAALLDNNPADATQYLNQVPNEYRGWEAGHLTATLARFELLAFIGCEILRVAVARDTGEVACGITGGFLAVVDPANPDAHEVHDLRKLFTHPRLTYFNCIDISPDGRTVLMALGTSRLIELDRRTGSIRDIRGEGKAPWAKYAGADIVAIESGRVRLIDRATDAERASLPHAVDAMDLFLSNDARALLMSRSDGTVALYDIDPAAPAISQRWCTAARSQPSRAIALTPDARHAVIAWRDSAISRLDCASGETLLEDDLDGGAVYDLAMSPDGSMVVASSWTNLLRVIDPVTLQIVDRIGGTFSHTWDIAFRPDGKRVYGRCVVEPLVPSPIRGLDEWLGSYDVAQRGATRDFAIGAEVMAAVADGVEGAATVCCVDGSLRRVDLRTGVVTEIGRTDLPVRSIAVRGDALLIGDAAGTIARLDLRPDGTLAESWRVRSVPGSITGLAWSPDGTRIACGGGGDQAALLDSANGSTVWIRTVPTGNASPDRRRVGQPVFLDRGSSVTFCMYASEATQLVLAMSDGRTLRGFAGKCYEGESFVQVPGSDYMIGAGNTGYALYFNETTMNEPYPLARDGGVIGIGRDGSRFVFASRDGSCRVASVEPVQELMRLDSPPGVPLATCMDVDAGMVSVITSRGMVRSWTNAVNPRSIPRPVPSRVLEMKRQLP